MCLKPGKDERSSITPSILQLATKQTRLRDPSLVLSQTSKEKGAKYDLIVATEMELLEPGAFRQARDALVHDPRRYV